MKLARWRRARWIITQHYAGRAMLFFRYHPRTVYAWTKRRDRATVFRSEADARHAVRSCEIGWRYRCHVERWR